MKVTYLVRETPGDTTSVLIEITKEQWKEIVKADRGIPTSKKRHFITDVIVDGNIFDCLVVEVGYEEYKRWHVEKVMSDRNRKLKQKYQHISLTSETLEEIPSTSSAIAAKDDSLTITEMEEAMAKWNEWAIPVYKLYLSGRKDDVVEYLMENCNISKATAYRYIQSFKDFVKNFMGV